jgi:hypothetical protein
MSWKNFHTFDGDAFFPDPCSAKWPGYYGLKSRTGITEGQNSVGLDNLPRRAEKPELDQIQTDPCPLWTKRTRPWCDSMIFHRTYICYVTLLDVE